MANESDYKAQRVEELAAKVLKQLPANARTARRALRDLVECTRDTQLRLEGQGGENYIHFAPAGDAAVTLEVGHECVVVSSLRRRVPVEFLVYALTKAVDAAGSIEEWIKQTFEGYSEDFIEKMHAELGPCEKCFGEHSLRRASR